ncbi:RNA-guided endonuclease InsQ/TnpB family protein [Levilactobacillus yonginensis]|uniref:RNA-guided endonuclease InsQ/TnpB family protein n=1 Tax=Levilactobacillus yonginensis TaxID=1054041 RepID=UPI00345D65CB
MRDLGQLSYHFGIKVRIYPSDQQKQLIKRNADAYRFVYNEHHAIRQRLEHLHQIKHPPTKVHAFIQHLTKSLDYQRMALNHPFLADPRIDAHVRLQAVIDYRTRQAAYLTGSAKRPHFLRKSYTWRYQLACQYHHRSHGSLRNGSIAFTDEHHVTLPIIGRLRVGGSQSRLLTRDTPIQICLATLTKDATNHYYLSLQLTSPVPFVHPLSAQTQPIGIDLNTANFLTTSTGHTVVNPHFNRRLSSRFRKAMRRLSLQRRLAQKERRPLRTAKNYQKQRQCVAKLLIKLHQQRENFLQQLSTQIFRQHNLVVAEELRGQDTARNYAMSWRFRDPGWISLLTMLRYKAQLYGRTFITVNPVSTTQTCSHCGYILHGQQKLTCRERTWWCPHCLAFHLRDQNAAQNILNRGRLHLA